LYSSISTNTEARSNFTRYGYYTVSSFIYEIVKDNNDPRLSVFSEGSQQINAIFLNTNVCHNKNYALFKETEDPAGMLAYLDEQLAATEAEYSRRAYIFGNLAPGSKHCNSRWAQRYNAIIERYQKTVVF
jgi:hypothetical protein